MRARIACVGAAALVWLASAQASPILGNLQEPSNGSAGISGQGELTFAVEFMTGPLVQSLTSATFVIRTFPNTSISGSLHGANDSAPTRPGPFLATLTAPALPNRFQPTTFTLSTPFVLMANTNYWIDLTATLDPVAQFDFDSSVIAPTGTGAVYVRTYFDDAFFAGLIPRFQLDAATAVVDEPSTAALLGGVAMLGLGQRARRRRRATA